VIKVGWKYEVHLHTSESSACGKTSGKEYVSKYRDLGYDGIFITDHFWNGNTSVPRELEWEDWVHRYCDSWRNAKEAGLQCGLQVFFGWESSYEGEDFLIYGLDEKWLLEHPEIITCDQKQQYELVHAYGGAVVQAHPFRERFYQTEVKLHPCHCDAWETANGGNEPYQDMLARRFAQANGIRETAGSDIHQLADISQSPQFAVVTDIKLTSERDYANLLRSGNGWHISSTGNQDCSVLAPWFPVWRYDSRNTRTEYYEESWKTLKRAPKP